MNQRILYSLFIGILCHFLIACDDKPSVPLHGRGVEYECVGRYSRDVFSCEDDGYGNPNRCESSPSISFGEPIPSLRECGNPGSPPDVISAMEDWCRWKCEEVYKEFFVNNEFPFFHYESPGECILDRPRETSTPCGEDSPNGARGIMGLYSHVPYVAAVSPVHSTLSAVSNGKTFTPNVIAGEAGHFIRCDELGCKVELVNMQVVMENFTHKVEDYKIPVKDIKFRLNSSSIGHYTPESGEVVFPPGEFDALLEFEIDGKYGNVVGQNEEDVVGTFDVETSTFQLKGEIPSADFSFDFSGYYTNEPPVISLNAPAGPVECEADYAATVAVSAEGSFDPQGGELQGLWGFGMDGVVNSTQANNSAPEFRLPLGTHTIMYEAINNRYARSVEYVDVVVQDTTAPVLEGVVNLDATTCNALETYVLTPPVATDACTSVASFEGYIIENNGMPLNPERLIEDDTVTLSPGNYVVEWRAVDEKGNESSVQQTVTIKSGIRTLQSFETKDRATVYSTVFNSGSGGTIIGKDATTASVYTAGNAELRDDATIEGDLIVEGRISRQNPDKAWVTGVEQEGAHINFRDVQADMLADVVFSQVSENYNLNSGGTYTLDPGTYPALNFNSNVTFILTAGEYYFNGLNINTDSVVILDKSNGPISINVNQQYSQREPFTNLYGDVEPVLLKFKGQNQATIDAPFQGTLMAPFARVMLGQDAQPETFSGRFLAKELVVAVGAILQCDEQLSF